jgi:hypothetical protein
MAVGVIGARVLLVVLVGGAVVSCNRDDDDGAARAIDVLIGAIRDVVSSHFTTGVEDAAPVVYVVGTADGGVPAAVQADVAEALHDEIDVRFADERDEPIESDEVDAPVADSGVLLIVDQIPTEGDAIDVPIEVYRSERDNFTVIFMFEERASSWVVTATSVVPSGV